MYQKVKQYISDFERRDVIKVEKKIADWMPEEIDHNLKQDGIPLQLRTVGRNNHWVMTGDELSVYQKIQPGITVELMNYKGKWFDHVVRDKWGELQMLSIELYQGKLRFKKDKRKLSDKVQEKCNEYNISKEFICDGCGNKYLLDNAVEINTPNLAGITLCKKCFNYGHK